MKKKALALSVLAVISSQAGAFKLDTGSDWNIRWDNTLKGNLGMRVDRAKPRVVDPANFDSARLFDDADYSVDRTSSGLTSARFDILSEMDVIWKQNYGFRVSGAGWYDAAYENSDNKQRGTLPNSGLPYDYSWAGLSYKPGQYSNKAEELSLFGGELLDAFVFGNWDIGDMALGVRAGRHTIYWGQSLLPTGALTGIAGSMAALDFAKGLAVPGVETKEIFMPSTKISSVLQLTDNITLNAYYEFEHLVHRQPATGTFWSPSEVLTDNGQFLALIAGTATSQRAGFRYTDDKIDDSGEYGFAIDYFIEALDLEAQLVYIKGSDRLLSGVWGSFNSSRLDPADIAQWAKPWDEGGANANVIGEFGWVYKKDIETYGISLGKQMFDISFGADIVYRKDTGLNPNFTPALTTRGNVTAADFNPNDFPGPTGDVWGVVINGVGLLNGDMGLWDGGSWIIEYTTSWLDSFGKNKQFAKPEISKGRVTTQIAANFIPTWYQVFPGWDMSLPVSVSYGIDGEQPPQSSISQEELGAASVGVRFIVNEVWIMDGKYIDRFGPVENGVGGGLVDRDSVTFTVKRTF